MSGTLRAILALAALLLAALRVLARGYLPYDDALRHAAKAVSGRPWSEILLMRPDMQLDSNPGWHWLLGAVHANFGLGTVDLVILSVLLLFLVFSVAPLVLLRRPEAWLIALLTVNVLDPNVFPRLMSGRPFLVSSAIVPLVLLLWPRLEPPAKRGVLALFVACGALAGWVHGAYYLLALPVLAVAGSGRWRAAARLAGCLAAGVVLGALLTGHPLGHLWQMLQHGYLSMGVAHASDALVTEFRPFEGRMGAVLAFAGLLTWRRVRHGAGDPSWWRDPVVLLVAGSWCLGYVAVRFWTDWGTPAFLVLVALEAQLLLERRAPERSGLGPLLGAAGLAVLALSADVQMRWSAAPNRPFLARGNAAHAPSLPEPGGIIYATEPELFYAVFFQNPDAPWRYVLGFEPALMPAEDYEVYSAIRRSRGVTAAYLPWLRKLRPEDRLIVRHEASAPPPIPGLEWQQPVLNVWSGRLPRAAAPAMPGDSPGLAAPTNVPGRVAP